MFLDNATIQVRAGDGGAGAVSFRRVAFIPHGGPDGGTGGKGADVVVRVDAHLTTLMDYRYRRSYEAESGGDGAGSNRTGRSGQDLVLRVPPGTVIRDAETGEVVAELIDPDAEVVVARGGRGGRGNASFATATHQAPRHAQPGEEGEERTLEFELKLIADVGLVGEPNAGKSTLLSVMSRATPKIAAYPFTTLDPNLGVVRLSDERSFVIADIPGIIEGAHDGRGLGLQFLRHIERTRTLALLIPADAIDPQRVYEQLRAELSSYSGELASKPFCVIFTKADLLPADWEPPAVQAPDAWGQLLISAVAGRGIDRLAEALWSRAASSDPSPEVSGTWKP